MGGMEVGEAGGRWQREAGSSRYGSEERQRYELMLPRRCHDMPCRYAAALLAALIFRRHAAFRHYAMISFAIYC